MMKKYIKPNVVSVATISEGYLLADTGRGSNGQWTSAKVSNFDETESESDQKEHTEN